MIHLLATDKLLIQNLVIALEITVEKIEKEQFALFAKAFEKKIKAYNKQQLLWLQQHMLIYSQIEENNKGLLTRKYLELIEQQLHRI